MKKFLIIFLVIFNLINVTGCQSNKAKINNASTIHIADNNIIFTVSEETITKSKATFKIENLSSETLYYGEPYHLETKENENWYVVEPLKEATFNMPLYILGKGESIDLEIDWSYLYGDLSPGEYRLVKDVSFKNADETFIDFYIGATFVIL